MRVARPIAHFLQEMAGVVLPLVTVMGITAVALGTLKMVPPLLREEPSREYGSIEEAGWALGQSISIPAYFPDYLAWPPASIVVQRQPNLEARLLFRSRWEGAEVLWIRQIPSRIEPPTPFFPQPVQVLERRTVALREAQGTLLVARAEDGTLYRHLGWISGDRYLEVTTRYPEEELLTMGRSMHP